jgi:hypothetical protein
MSKKGVFTSPLGPTEKNNWLGIQWNNPLEISQILEPFLWLATVTIRCHDEAHGGHAPTIQFQFVNETRTIFMSRYLYLNHHWKRVLVPQNSGNATNGEINQSWSLQLSTALLSTHFNSDTICRCGSF